MIKTIIRYNTGKWTFAALVIVCLMLFVSNAVPVSAAGYKLFKQSYKNDSITIKLDKGSITQKGKKIVYKKGKTKKTLCKAQILSNVMKYKNTYYYVAYASKGKAAVYSLKKNGKNKSLKMFKEKEASLMKEFEPYGGEIKITGVKGNSIIFYTRYDWDDEGEVNKYAFNLKKGSLKYKGSSFGTMP